jgi:AcrR family transcriptional regulator
MRTVKKGRVMKKMDIRTRFTQKALKDSLLELMRTTPIRNIPIKAICADAGVSRSTFYTYYDDQYDLLEEIQNETLNNFDAEYSKHLKEPARREGSSYYEEGLRYIIDNHDSIQVLLGENGDINFQKKVIEERIMVTKERAEKSIDEKIKRSYSVFFVNGSLAMLQDWIKHGMDVPISEMAKLYSEIANNFLQ